MSPIHDPLVPQRLADWVLIGTSPLILIQAIRLANAGESVLLVEKSKDWGGAWKTRDLWGFQGLEVAVHSIRNRKQVYTFLTEEYGIDLNCVEAVGFLGTKKLSLRWYRLLCMVDYLLRDGVHMRFSELIDGKGEKGLPIVWRFIKSLHTEFEYPHGGCGELIEKLKSKIAVSSVISLDQTEVDAIFIDTNCKGGKCETNHGSIRFNKVMIGSNLRCPIFIEAGEPLEISTQISTHTNVLLYVNGKKKVDFTYAEKRSDPIVKRVRDIGINLRELLPDRQLYGVMVNPSFAQVMPDDDALAEQVLQRLIETKLLSDDSLLIEFNVERQAIEKISNIDVASLNNRYGPALYVQRTGDFGEELCTLLSNLQVVSQGPR